MIYKELEDAQREQMIAELRRLREIDKALPHTVDGAAIVPGMKLYRTDTTEVRTVIWVSHSTAIMDDQFSIPWCPDYCYSKKSLALAALAVEAAKKETT